MTDSESRASREPGHEDATAELGERLHLLINAAGEASRPRTPAAVSHWRDKVDEHRRAICALFASFSVIPTTVGEEPAMADGTTLASLAGRIIAIDAHHEPAWNEETDDDDEPVEPLVPHGRAYITLDVNEVALLSGPVALRTMGSTVTLSAEQHAKRSSITASSVSSGSPIQDEEIAPAAQQTAALREALGVTGHPMFAQLLNRVRDGKCEVPCADCYGEARHLPSNGDGPEECESCEGTGTVWVTLGEVSELQ